VNRSLFYCLLLSLSLFANSLASALEPSLAADLVNSAELQALISEVEVNESLEPAAKEELLSQLKLAESFLKNTASYKELTRGYIKSRETARGQAAAIKKQLEAAVNNEEDVVVEFEKTMVLADLEHQLQKDQASLATESARLTDAKSKLQIETTRAKELRLRLSELSKISSELSASPVPAATSTATDLEKAQRLVYVARVEAVQVETQMLDEEHLSQPMRVELLKAQQDAATYASTLFRNRTQAYQIYVIKLRQEEAEKALNKAESVAEEAEGKHPLILQLATDNAELSGQSSQVTADMEDIRDQELKAREQAKRYEDDLQSIQLKLEIVGMSQAMGQVLREQQIRLPQTAQVLTTPGEREKKISSSSLRQLEYEDERRRVANLRVYLETRTAQLDEEDRAEIEDEMRELGTARRELLVTAIDLEGSYLRALGDLDFTARRLVVSADAYSVFISERLLWIRSSAPFSLQTLLDLGPEIVRFFTLKQWIQLAVSLVQEAFGSLLFLVMLLAAAVMVRFRGNLLAYLKTTGDHVGNIEKDKLRYSFVALALSCLLALRWPFLMLTLGLIADDSETQPELGQYVSDALIRASYYFYGFEILRHLVIPEGLFKRHFQWGDSTLHSLAAQLRSLEQVFVPAVVLAIISTRMFAAQGESVFAVLLLMIGLIAMTLFFVRLPNFMEGRLDTLLLPGSGPLSNFWSRGVRALLIAIPCLLIVTMSLGYSGTATSFLVLLLLTVSLFSVILLANELGMRWLRLVQLRLIKAEREAAEAEAARIVAEGEEVAEDEDLVHFSEPDPNALDSDGRKLLTSILGISAIFGIWAVWADVLPALGILNNINLWNQTVTIDGRAAIAPVTLADVGMALLVGFVGYVAIQRVPGILDVILRQKMNMPAGTVYAVRTLFRYSLVTVVVVVVLGILGGSWSQIQWAVAALSVGIGFGLQEIVANFICGIILLFEQPIRVGDTVTVGTASGVVTKIRMRATTIRDWDRFELLVPNKEFITGRLLNWSLSDHINRVVIEVGVSYGTNLKDAMELALQVASEHPEILEDPAPFVTFDEFGDNSLKLVLRGYLGSVDSRLGIASQMRLAIDEKFNAAGIVISFPQRDVHLDTSAPLEITLSSSDGRVPT
jgi:potassium efflux system protein